MNRRIHLFVHSPFMHHVQIFLGLAGLAFVFWLIATAFLVAHDAATTTPSAPSPSYTEGTNHNVR